MKKCAVMAIVLACLFFIGTCMTAEAQKVTASQKQVMVDRNNDSKIDGVDIYDDSGKVAKRGYDTNNDMVVDRWETYDENTGMPIVTESDEAFELR